MDSKRIETLRTILDKPELLENAEMYDALLY